MDFGLSFHVPRSQRKRWILLPWNKSRLSSIIFNSPFEFKRLFGLTRSLFILYIHEHDRLGFGMLTEETAVIHLVVSQSGRILFGIGGTVL